MTELDYLAFDADNHYYEAVDAFTRYLDPKWADRTVRWCDIDGRKYPIVGGRLNRAVANPTFDPIAKPGAMHEYFRGNPNRRSAQDFLADREPIPAYYRQPGARLQVMDQQGVEKVWMFPTLGGLYEEPLKHDPEAVCVAFTAFNRWLKDDWGLNYQDQIYTAPYIAMADVDHAVSELEWALANNARVLAMRPAAATTAQGQMSPFARYFDPFWARVSEAGIAVVVHAGDSGYSSQGYANDTFDASFRGAGAKPSLHSFAMERSAHDFLISTVLDKLFERFPGVRLCSVENGSEFLGELFKKLRSTAKKVPDYFTEDPVETFRRHVWINPFWEDDPFTVIEHMGADHVIFGSDWPHVEGMPEPLDYVNEVDRLDPSSLRMVMRDNTIGLTEFVPA